MSVPPPSQTVAKMRLPPGSMPDLAVDQGAPRARRPPVDRVAGVGGEVRPVHLLHRRDVEHHEGLRRAPLLEVVAGGRGARPGAVGHHRVLRRVVGRGELPEPPALVRVLEPEGVPDLVQHGHVVVVARPRRAPRSAEPDVAAHAGAGEEGVGGGGVGGVRHPHVARPRCRRPAKLTERLVKPSTEKPAVALRDGVERPPDGGELRGRQPREAVGLRRPPVAVVVAAVAAAVVRGRVGRAVGDPPARPAVAGQYPVDTGIPGPMDRSQDCHSPPPNPKRCWTG